MRPSTILRFNLGSASAIREVAADRSAFWIGLILVLLTGIARNYDQSYFLETPLWLVGPLLFSLVSGTFLYAVIIRGFARFHFEPARTFREDWRTFMSLFWMTAPIAWLYAVPVERFLNSYQSAQANLTLLAIVSIWRVILMTRVLNIVLAVPFSRCFAWVLLAASIEVIVVFFLGFLFGGFSRRILAGMSGMRNSPEEDLMLKSLNLVWAWSWAILFVTALRLAAFRFKGTARGFPPTIPGRLPKVTLIALAIVWIAITLPAQHEQRRYDIHAKLIDQKKHSEALNYLSSFKPSDFPPSRRLRPNPFEYEVWTSLPTTVSLINSDTPIWIRSLYLSHLSASFRHMFSSYPSLTNVSAMYSAIEKLPEGREWLQTNQEALARQGLTAHYTTPDTPIESGAYGEIIETFSRMGMSETNRMRLKERE